jgi:hypothetical protein
MFQVVLASTQARMAVVPPNHTPAYGADDFQTILRTLKIDRNYLLGHYGADRGEWVPFACGKSITQSCQRFGTASLAKEHRPSAGRSRATNCGTARAPRPISVRS